MSHILNLKKNGRELVALVLEVLVQFRFTIIVNYVNSVTWLDLSILLTVKKKKKKKNHIVPDTGFVREEPN